MMLAGLKVLVGEPKSSNLEQNLGGLNTNYPPNGVSYAISAGPAQRMVGYDVTHQVGHWGPPPRIFPIEEPQLALIVLSQIPRHVVTMDRAPVWWNALDGRENAFQGA